MKSFIVLALFVAAAVAAPAGPEAQARIIAQESDNIGIGEYRSLYDTENGIRAEETGVLTDVGTQDEGIAVRGSYEYPGPDGVIYKVIYIADKNGFQPQGAHIPV